MTAGERVAARGDVPADSTFLFTVRDAETGEEREAILLAAGDGGAVRGWLNYCRHLTFVRLDKGSGATLRGDELVCTNHGAMFDRDTGLCTFGPCEGAYLEPVDVTVEGEAVYLTDPDYEFVASGPAEDDRDLTSRSNVEF